MMAHDCKKNPRATARVCIIRLFYESALLSCVRGTAFLKSNHAFFSFMDFTDWTDFLPFVTEKSVTSVQSVSKEIVNRDFKKALVSEERRLAYGYAAESAER